MKHLIYTEKSNINLENNESHNDSDCSINCCSRSIDNGICCTRTKSIGMGRRFRRLRWRLWRFRRRLWRLWRLRRRLWRLRRQAVAASAAAVAASAAAVAASAAAVAASAAVALAVEEDSSAMAVALAVEEDSSAILLDSINISYKQPVKSTPVTAKTTKIRTKKTTNHTTTTTKIRTKKTNRQCVSTQQLTLLDTASAASAPDSV